MERADPSKTFQVLIDRFPVEQAPIRYLGERNMKLLESEFISNLLYAFDSGQSTCAEGDGKIVYLGFGSILCGDWRAQDFAQLCRRAPVLFLDNVETISLNHIELVRVFSDLLGK